MASINFTNAAKEDSRSIFADLETKAGAYTVEKYFTEFSRLYDHLSGFPESGAPRRKLGAIRSYWRRFSISCFLSLRRSRRYRACSPRSERSPQSHPPYVAAAPVTAMIYGHARVSTDGQSIDPPRR